MSMHAGLPCSPSLFVLWPIHSRVTLFLTCSASSFICLCRGDMKSGARGWGRWLKWRKFYEEQSWTRYHCSRQVSRLLERWFHNVFLRLDPFDYYNFKHSWNCRVLQLPLERVVNENCVCAPPAQGLLCKMLDPQMHWSAKNSSL